jgi:hypothetical protein
VKPSAPTRAAADSAQADELPVAALSGYAELIAFLELFTRVTSSEGNGPGTV